MIKDTNDGVVVVCDVCKRCMDADGYASTRIGEELEGLFNAPIKPDLVLNMKRDWFAKVWNGEKKVGYREVKPHWMVRIGSWVGKDPLVRFVEMRIGYMKDGPVMLLQVHRADIGKCPYEGWNGEYFRLHFEVMGKYWRSGDGVYTPSIYANCRMKEKGI